MKQRALLLVNPQARRGEATQERVKEVLNQLGLDVIEAAVETPGDFPQAIRTHQDQVDRVIIGGGDGSVNAAIAGLLDTHLPVGIIPLGTANNLARTLNLPTELEAACEVIAAGQTRSIDLGWVNGQYFLNVAGLGLSTRVNLEVEPQTKRRWGVIAYIATALKLAFKQRRFRAAIQCNDEIIRVKTYQITVCNGRHYGSGLTVAADATIDDERLDLCSLEIQHWWQVFSLIPALNRGEYATGQGIRTLSGQSLYISTVKPYPIDTDGEVTTQTPAFFQIVPQAIEVFVP